jgi:hypothetical protein
MGKLAMAGALAGLGKGIHEYGADTQAAQAEAQKTAHDDARAEAMVRLKARLDKEARQQGYEHETEIQGMRGEQAVGIQQLKGEQAKELQGGEQEFKGGEAEKQRQYEAVQTDKKLTSAEKIAGIKADATESGSKGKTWKLTKLKTGGDFNPATGETTPSSERVAITSPKLGLTFVQQGTLFIPQDPEDRAKMRQPKDQAGAMKWLQDNPAENAQTFLQTYHWLPASVMKYLVE